ncbi:hypothetical protein J3F83DRAFT_209639 [Trichoderma novae-zelandiae]
MQGSAPHPQPTLSTRQAHQGLEKQVSDGGSQPLLSLTPSSFIKDLKGSILHLARGRCWPSAKTPRPQIHCRLVPCIFDTTGARRLPSQHSIGWGSNEDALSIVLRQASADLAHQGVPADGTAGKGHVVFTLLRRALRTALSFKDVFHLQQSKGSIISLRLGRAMPAYGAVRSETVLNPRRQTRPMFLSTYRYARSVNGYTLSIAYRRPLAPLMLCLLLFLLLVRVLTRCLKKIPNHTTISIRQHTRASS